MKSKVIVNVKGGLGNQLFCYAAARRLALVNEAELVIDDVSAFTRDFAYRRRYRLDHFSIRARKATPYERMEPFGRYRRRFAKILARGRSFHERKYLEQDGRDFDRRLLEYKVRGVVYLDGYWQSEGYFKDVEDAIRRDLRIGKLQDCENQEVADQIRNTEAVCVHVRRFGAHFNPAADLHDLKPHYYRRAIGHMESTLDHPHYFVFSDDLEHARRTVEAPRHRVTWVSHSRVLDNDCVDMWLMTLCRHFIIANSTFSWWGAWLSDSENRIVIAPDMKVEGIGAWGFSGLIPDGWICEES